MRRMIPDPGKILKCNFENVGRVTTIHVPIKSLTDLPITFDLIIDTKGVIIHTYAWYSAINEEVYGGGYFVDNSNDKGLINITTNLNSLIDPEIPYLDLELVYKNDNIQNTPLTEYDRVFVTNITHLEQGVIEVTV